MPTNNRMLDSDVLIPKQPPDVTRNSVKSAESTDATSKQIDGGFGWIIVAATFFLCFGLGTIFGSIAMLYPAFREEFGVNAETIGWVISLAGTSQSLTGMFCGPAIDRYGSRGVAVLACFLLSIGLMISAFSPNIYVLFAAYTIFWGPAMGILLLSFIVIIQRWFTKNRSLAHSLSVLGVPCGIMTSGPLTHTLIDTYSWRGCQVIYSGLALQCLVFISIYRSPPMPNVSYQNGNDNIHRNNNCKVNKKRKISSLSKILDISLFKNIPFLMFVIAESLSAYGLTTNQIHIPSRAIAIGIPLNQVQLIPIFMGMFNAIGTVSAGLLGKTGDLVALTGLAMGLLGLGQILIGFTGRHFIWNVVFTSFSNFMIGFYLTLQPPLMSDIVGVQRLGRAYGIFSLILIIPQLTTNPFSGWMYDISGNYNLPFYVTGALTVISGIMMYTLLCMPSYFNKKADIQT